MATKVIYKTDIALETCCNCGIPFGMPQELMDSLKKSGNSFFCPNGHSQYYTQRESLEEQLKKAKAQLAQAKEAEEWYEKAYSEQRAEAKEKTNLLRGARAANTKLKNRIKNGACPCCHRQFVNLRRHMETKHPDYIEASA